MSFFEGTIYSKTLHMDTQLGVILPHDSRLHYDGTLKNDLKPREVPKTLILLHGLTDNASAWWRRTPIERYAEEYDMAVIMPEVYKSFYQDMKYGEDYFTYITEELPELCSRLFHVSIKPEDLMIAGLSMGGYGALRCMLTYPERYCSCGAFSAACDLREISNPDNPSNQTGPARGFYKNIRAIYGEDVEIDDTSDLFYLAEQLGEKSELVHIYQTCGRQDFLWEANQRLKTVLEKVNLKEYYYEDWDGVHEWGYWDTAIQKFMKLFCRNNL